MLTTIRPPEGGDIVKIMRKEDIDRVRGWGSEGGTPYNHALHDLIEHIDALTHALAPFAAHYALHRIAADLSPTEIADRPPIQWATYRAAFLAMQDQGSTSAVGLK